MSLAISKGGAVKLPWQSDSDRNTQALIDSVARAGARRWAVNEAGAAIAQQLVEPLTALMVYMQELKSSETVQAAGASHALQGLVDGALREAERVCAVMQRISKRTTADGSSEFAIGGGGNDAINWWANADGAAETSGEEMPAGHHTLTPREHEVLNLVSGGVTNKEGALLLKISPRTFEAHRAQIMRKLGARNVADLLRKVLVEPR
jgi:DNA-binding CsgD family transcriptional regulator